MKTPLYLTFILLCIIPSFLIAQDTIRTSKSHRLKLNAFRFFSDQFIVGYEMGQHHHYAFGAELGYLTRANYLEFLRNRNLSVNLDEPLFWNWRGRATSTPLKLGLQFNAYYRLYHGFSHNGVFLGVKTGIQYADFGVNIPIDYLESRYEMSLSETKINARQKMFFGGFEAGYNFKKSGRLNYEFSVLAGKQFLSFIKPQSIDDSIKISDPRYYFLRNHPTAVGTYIIEFNFNIIYKLGH